MTDRDDLRDRLDSLEARSDATGGYEPDEQTNEQIDQFIEKRFEELSPEKIERLDELATQIEEEPSADGYELTEAEKEYHAILLSGEPET